LIHHQQTPRVVEARDLWVAINLELPRAKQSLVSDVSMLIRSWFRVRGGCVLALAAILAAAGPIRGQVAVVPVTGLPEELLPGLEPLLKAAATRSPEAIRRSLEVDAAEGRKLVGKSVMLPSLSGSARYAVNDEAVSGNSGTSNRSSGFFYNFALNQPVYHWGALQAQADREKIGLRIAERQYAEAIRLLLQQIRRGYLEIVQHRAALRVLRFQLGLEESAVVQQKQRLEAHLAVPGDVAGAELAVDRRKLDIEMAEAALDFGRHSLARLAGLDGLADDAFPEDFPRPQPEPAKAESLLRAFTQGGVMHTYQADVFGLSIHQSEQDYIVARHRLYPKFSVYAGYDVRSETQASASSLNQVAVRDRNYGLKMDWSLFDGWATKGEKLKAIASRRSNERQLQVHIETTVDAARALHQQLGFAARALDFAERGLIGAQAYLKQVQDELAAGRMSAAEVDRAKLALLQAEVQILPARADYLNRWAEFVSLVGADPAMNHVPARYAR
jgi:outer membrane protein TolC